MPDDGGIWHFVHCLDPTNAKRATEGVLSVHALLQGWNKGFSPESIVLGDDVLKEPEIRKEFMQCSLCT